MDISICTGPVLQLLPQMVNVQVDAPLSQKMMEGISSQVCILSWRYSFQAFQCDQHSTCWSIYIQHSSDENFLFCFWWKTWSDIWLVKNGLRFNLRVIENSICSTVSFLDAISMSFTFSFNTCTCLVYHSNSCSEIFTKNQLSY